MTTGVLRALKRSGADFGRMNRNFAGRIALRSSGLNPGAEPRSTSGDRSNRGDGRIVTLVRSWRPQAAMRWAIIKESQSGESQRRREVVRERAAKASSRRPVSWRVVAHYSGMTVAQMSDLRRAHARRPGRRSGCRRNRLGGARSQGTACGGRISPPLQRPDRHRLQRRPDRGLEGGGGLRQGQRQARDPRRFGGSDDAGCERGRSRRRACRRSTS